MGKFRPMTSDQMLPSAIRLRTFDKERLKADLAAVERVNWRPESPFFFEHTFGNVTPVYHNGQWHGITLRSQGGGVDRTDPGGPGMVSFADTELFKHAPYIRSVLDSISAPKRTARLLALDAGGRIEEHRDTYHGFPYGQLRLHIPIVTHPDVTFTVGGVAPPLEEGELWYFDFTQPHAVRNDSSIRRVHLVFDVIVTPAVVEMFPAEYHERISSMGVLYHEKSVSLDRADLSRYACDFTIAAGLMRGIFQMDDAIAPEFQGRIRLVDNQLVLSINDLPMFALEPLGEVGRFGLVGWTPERHFEFVVGSRGVSTVRLVMRHGHERTAIEMPARAV